MNESEAAEELAAGKKKEQKGRMKEEKTREEGRGGGIGK
jgi:hypothetical protein